MRSFFFGDGVMSGEDSTHPAATTTAAARSSVARDTMDSAVSGSGGLDANFPYPNDVLALLQSIHQGLLDKAEEHEGHPSGHEPNHLLNRSYTIRTVNDNGSLDGRGPGGGSGVPMMPREGMMVAGSGSSGEGYGVENEFLNEARSYDTQQQQHNSGRRVAGMIGGGGTLFDTLHDIPEDAVLPAYFTPQLLQATANHPPPSSDSTFLLSPGGGGGGMSPIRHLTLEDSVLEGGIRPTTPLMHPHWAIGIGSGEQEGMKDSQEGEEDEGDGECECEEGEDHLIVKITSAITANPSHQSYDQYICQCASKTARRTACQCEGNRPRTHPDRGDLPTNSRSLRTFAQASDCGVWTGLVADDEWLAD